MSAKDGLAIPPSSTPISDPGSVAFSNTWYLFWVAIGSKVISILRRIATLESADQTVDQTLTVASTTIFAPTTGAKRLIEIVRQDTTGGRAIVWDPAGFSAGAPVSLGAAAASTFCIFGFVQVGAKYLLTYESPKDMTP